MFQKILGPGRQSIIADTCADTVDVDSDVDAALYIAPVKKAEVLVPWTEWIKRDTHRVENQLQKFNIKKSWDQQAKSRMWNFARRLTEHVAHRWTRRL